MRPEPVAVGVLAVALVAWVVTLDRMRGMDAGPGTDLGALGWFLGVWTTMMAAMMLPSALPAIVVFTRAARGGTAALSSRAGYLLVWAAYGLAAYGVYRLLAAAAPSFLAWDDAGPYVAGAAIVAAGLYELTPLKAVCLRHCRSPLHFLLARWRPGTRGALLMGGEHGLWCAGCCWALMVVLFAVGVMSVAWMAVIALVVFAEKVLPGGRRLTLGIAAALVVLGLWIALAPGSVPGLTEPGGTAPMEMGMGE